MAEELIANEEDRELASKPIPSLVRRYTIVTGQGMLAQIIMVVLEGLVMGWGLGAHGLACVSIIMSAEFLNLAFGNLFGTGVPAIVGNLLGAGDVKGASKAFSQGFWLTSIVSIILAVIMAVFTEPICAFFGATPDIMADTVLGVRTFSILLPFTVVGQMVTAVMRVDEKVQIQANLMTVSAIIAIVWLALSTFIFKLGTMGAGIYYGLSIGIWAIGAFWFVGGKKSQLQIKLADLKLDMAICGQIFKIGFPFFLVQAATFIFNTVANTLLGTLGGELGSLYIAAFAVINGYILYIVMMIAQCFSYGLQPIAAFNAGAKAWDRLKQSLSCAIKYQIIVLLVVSIVIWLAATPRLCLLCRKRRRPRGSCRQRHAHHHYRRMPGLSCHDRIHLLPVGRKGRALHLLQSASLRNLLRAAHVPPGQHDGRPGYLDRSRGSRCHHGNHLHRPRSERAEAPEQASRLATPTTIAPPIQKRRPLAGGCLFLQRF